MNTAENATPVTPTINDLTDIRRFVGMKSVAKFSTPLAIAPSKLVLGITAVGCIFGTEGGVEFIANWLALSPQEWGIIRAQLPESIPTQPPSAQPPTPTDNLPFPFTSLEHKALKSALLNRHTKLYSRIQQDQANGDTGELEEEVVNELAALERAAQKLNITL